MTVQPQTLAKPLRELFVSRNDTYCVQNSEGYRRIEEPLTDRILEKHLAGEITVGSYQLSEGSLVKWLCFDLDPEKLAQPEAIARQILKTVESRVSRQSVIVEASRFDDPSFHIWILFLMPVKAKVARWLGLRILELASLDPKKIEVFPKQAELTKERPFGNFVKLPLGRHQAANKWSRLLDFDTFKPLPNSRILDAVGVTFTDKELEQIEAFETTKKEQGSYVLPKTFKPLNDKEEEKTVRFLCRYWREGVRNRLECYFLGLAIKRGVSLESAERIITAVTARTNDPEATARLALVEYHYKNRLSGRLKGITGIREIIEECQQP